MPGTFGALAPPADAASAPPTPLLTCVLLLSPLRGPDGKWRTRRQDFPAGDPLVCYLPEREPLARVSVNGAIIEPSCYETYVPRPGDEVWLWPQWGDPTGGILTGALISLAVGLAVSAASHFLFRPKPLLLPQQNTMTEAPEHTFSFEGIRTAIGPGGVVPVVYGRHRIGGQLLRASVDHARVILDTGTNPSPDRPVTNVTYVDPANLVQITCPAHGFVSNQTVRLHGIQLKNTLNKDWIIAVVDPDNFVLLSSWGIDVDLPYHGGGAATLTFTGEHRYQAVTQPPTLSLLLALGEGPIHAIQTETIEINGQPIGNFAGVQLFTRLGEADQPVINELSETGNTFSDGREIAGSPGITYTSQGALEAFVLNLTFPQGLYFLNQKGEKEANWVRLQYRFRTFGTTVWSPWFVFTVAADRTATVRMGLRRENLARQRYDIQLEYVMAGQTDELRARFQPALESVTEFLPGLDSYPYTALLGIRALATEQLQGTLPNVTVIIQGRRVRIGSLAGPEFWSNNPSWCVLDLLTNPRYGRGRPDSEIDLPAWTLYAAYCEQLIHGEPRHTLNYVLDRETRAQTAFLETMGGSRGILLKSAGLWTPRPTLHETPTALLSWTNSTNVRLTYLRDVDAINVMEARFINEESNFENDVLTWPPLEAWPAVIEKQSLDLRGVTKPSRVQRAMQYELNRRRFENQLLEMDCSAEALTVQVHDLFRFAHPLPSWGAAGRLEEGSTLTTLHLDAEVFVDGSVLHILYVRHANDAIDMRPVIGPGGWTSVVLVASALSQVPVPRMTTWVYGRADQDAQTRTFRVTSVQRQRDLSVHIEAIIHNPSIYDDPFATPLPPIGGPFNPLGPAPPLLLLLATEVTRIQPSGASMRVVNLSWDVAPLSQAYAPYGGATILRRTILASGQAGQATAGAIDLGAPLDLLEADANYVVIGQVRGHVLDFDDPTVLTGATYIYRVIPISTRGVPNNPGARDVMITVTGPTTPGFFPGTPQNLRLRGQPVGVTTFEGRDIHLEWDPVPPSALFTDTFFVQEYLLEVWAPGQLYLMRHTAVPITDPRASSQFSYTFEQHTEDQIRLGQPGARRDVLFLVWARTNTGLQSLEPASLTVSNPPPDMSEILPEVTPLDRAAMAEWDQWVEPRDLSQYTVYVDTVTPPGRIWQDASGVGSLRGRAFRKIFLQDLPAQVTHYVQILPWDTFGPGIPSGIASFIPNDVGGVDEIPPATPTGLVLTTGTVINPDGTIVPWVEAHWNPNTESDLAGYDLQFRTPPSLVPTTFSTGPTSTSYRVQPIAGGITVHVKLLAYDRFRNMSPYTAEASITTAGDTLPPAPPSGLLAFGSVGAVSLLWTPPGDLDYSHSEVWAAPTNDRTTAQRVGDGKFSFMHGSLSTLDPWYYWVRAVDTSGNLSPFFPPSATAGVVGTPTGIDPGILDTTPPAVPTGLALTTGSVLSADGTNLPWVRASWTANTEPDLGGYQVNFRVAGSLTPTILQVDAAATDVMLQPVPGNTTVACRIAAFDKVRNQSAFTGEVSLTTSADALPPGVPAGFFVTGSFRAIIVGWVPPGDPDYDYTEVWASVGNDRATAQMVGTALTIFVHENIATGQTWYYWIRSVDRSGNLGAFIPGPLAGMPGTPTPTSSNDIGNLSITETQISDNAISTPKLQANSVDANKVTTGELITLGAQIRSAIIGDAHITSLTATKLTAGTLQALVSLGVGAGAVYIDGPGRNIAVYDEANTLRVGLGKLGPLSTDYGLFVLNAAGQLMFHVSTGVTANGISAGVITAGHLRTDTAVITGGAQIANALITTAHIVSLSASQIDAGILNVLVTLGVGSGAIYLDGPGRNIAVFDANNVFRAGLGKLGPLTTDYGLVLANAAGQVMWNFATGSTTEGIGDDTVNAAKIKVGVINAGHLRTDTAVITGVAQIAAALIGDAHINSLSASKLLAGTITVGVGIGSGAAAIYIDGANRFLAVHDANTTPRVQLGKLGAGVTDYGLYLWNAAGQLMLDFNTGATTFGLQDLAVTNAKIANLAVDSAKVFSLSADKLVAGTIFAPINLGSLGRVVINGPDNNLLITDEAGTLRIILGRIQAGSTAYGLQVRNVSNQLMYNFAEGATTVGIVPHAVSASLTYVAAGVTILSGTETVLATVTFPTLNAGDEVWLSGKATLDIGTALHIGVGIREDSVTGTALDASFATAVESTIPTHTVYVASSTLTNKTFVMTGGIAGSGPGANASAIKLVALRLQR